MAHYSCVSAGVRGLAAATLVLTTFLALQVRRAQAQSSVVNAWAYGISDAGAEVICQTGYCVAQALAMDQVSTIVISNDITLQRRDFPYDAPIYRRKSVTIRGAAVAGPGQRWTLLDFNFVGAMVRTHY